MSSLSVSSPSASAAAARSAGSRLTLRVKVSWVSFPSSSSAVYRMVTVSSGSSSPKASRSSVPAV